jgi:hypothetical protein
VAAWPSSSPAPPAAPDPPAEPSHRRRHESRRAGLRQAQPAQPALNAAAAAAAASGGAAAAAEALEELERLAAALPDESTPAEALFARRRAALTRALPPGGAPAPALAAAWAARLAAAAAPRGVAVCAGGAVALSNAFVTLHVLRHALRCALPVAVLHWGAEEVDPGSRAFFAAHLPGVSFLDMAAAGPYPAHQAPLWARGGRPQGARAGWVSKAAALYYAPFREVLLLDADCQPLQDVAGLFEADDFRRHGST